MTKTEQEKQRDYVVRQVGRDIVGGGWAWRGTEFVSSRYCNTRRGKGGVGTSVHFAANYNNIKVTINQEEYYNIPDAIGTFTGENALNEAVQWAADKLLELDQIVSARVAKYEVLRDRVIEDYDKAQRGLI